MIRLSGKSVCKGTAIGEILVLKRQELLVRQWETNDPRAEIARLDEAIEETKRQLRSLHARAQENLGAEGAIIFQIHYDILDDGSYRDMVCDLIRAKLLNAEKAVELVGSKYADSFENAPSGSMSIRRSDIRDVSKRLIRCLTGEKDITFTMTRPVILIADDLSPSEAVLIDRENVLAIITREGSVHSHAASFARMMNIPAVAGVPVAMERLKSGTKAVVDGSDGLLIINPDDRIIRAAHRQIEEEHERAQLLSALEGKESKTKSGKMIQVYANAANIKDVEQAMEHDAEGIGLFRSECLCFNRGMFPGEEVQYRMYKQILEYMGDRKVIIRTMDLGSDKKVSYMRYDKEANPALGLRGIRISLAQPDILKMQLRALLRASVYGNLSIMYPMITYEEELDQIQEIVKEVKKELFDKGLPYKVPEQGIMIETPAAALLSENLAKKVDFFSIGTNDLAQFTLAVDRQNRQLTNYFDESNEAVMKLVQMTVDAGHKENIWVGVCGDIAAETGIAKRLIAMGVDELSVPAANVLKIRKIVCEAE